MLVEFLGGIEGPEASRAIADRAIFDLSEVVRIAAIDQLRLRDVGEYRERLLRALWYPWAPAAFHAAEALVAVNDKDSVPRLVELLGAGDPTAPFKSRDGTLQKTELVRVNHLRNCLLCHPRSTSRTDLVRGVVPTPGRRLPQKYYASPSGESVHADITYLRQDFSVVQPVANHGHWPRMQRFDFFLRTRALTEEETRQWSAATASDAADYPQREAVRLVLRKLRSSNS